MKLTLSQLRPIVVAGHVCLDLFPDFGGSSLPPNGGLSVVGPLSLGAGGAVGNVGLTLLQLGAPVRLIAAVGVDEVSELLRRQFPEWADLRFAAATNASTSYSVVLTPSGCDRSFLHCPGANQEFDPASVTDASFAGCSALHFGYPPIVSRTFSDGGEAMADLFRRARTAGLRTSLDFCSIDPSSAAAKVDWVDWMKRVLPEVDLFTPSLPELSDMLRSPAAGNRTDLRGTAQRVLDFGCGAAAIKLGENGLYVAGARDPARIASARLPTTWNGIDHLEPCFRVEIINTTGAGDSTIAGLLVAAEIGLNPQETAALATGAGACRCEAGSARLTPSVEEIAQRIAGNWAKRSSAFD